MLTSDQGEEEEEEDGECSGTRAVSWCLVRGSSSGGRIRGRTSVSSPHPHCSVKAEVLARWI